MNQIGQIASGVLEYDFDFITGATDKAAELLTISGSLSGHVGQLNVLINQSFGYTGDFGDVDPALQEEEKEILVQLYLKDYYFKEARRVLRSLYDPNSTSSFNQSEWTELREGDTTIKRGVFSAKDRNDASRNYKGLAEEADRKITELVGAYNVYGAQPRQVAGNDAGYVPTGSGYYC